MRTETQRPWGTLFEWRNYRMKNIRKAIYYGNINHFSKVAKRGVAIGDPVLAYSAAMLCLRYVYLANPKLREEN
jgi:hypothetical protein